MWVDIVFPGQFCQSGCFLFRQGWVRNTDYTYFLDVEAECALWAQQNGKIASISLEEIFIWNILLVH